MHALLLLAALASPTDWQLASPVAADSPLAWELCSIEEPAPVADWAVADAQPLVFGKVVHVWGGDWCHAYRAVPRYSDWVFHSHDEDDPETPEWVVATGKCPVLHFQRSDGQWRFVCGWAKDDPETPEVEGEKWFRGVLEREEKNVGKPAKKSYMTEAPANGGYPVRGNHWTHPGDIYQHLIATHGYSADYVRTLTRAEALSLHDDDHEGRVKMQAIGQKRTRVLARATYSCPTCPR